MIATRKFSQRDYAAFDRYKHIVVDRLNQSGWDAWVNGDQYGVDIVGWSRRGRLFTADVEVKAVDFTGQADFPFPTVRFTERKRKYGMGFFYIVLSMNGAAGYYACGRDIYRTENAVVRRASRNGATAMEGFYELPKEKVVWFSI